MSDKGENLWLRSPLDSIANFAKYNHESDSDGSAFLSPHDSAPGTLSGDPQFIIDCGASDHMVVSAALLTNLYSIPHRNIIYGDRNRLPCTQAGTLTLGNLVLRHVLVVPNSGSNLISVCKTPVSHKWDIDQVSGVANLFDRRSGSCVLSATLQRGLFTIKASQLNHVHCELR